MNDKTDLSESDLSESGPSESGLSEVDKKILTFEHRWWKHPGAKERAIREALAMSPTGYYQALNALIDRLEALEHDPVLVQRLRRMREARRRARSSN
jgi:hypothetical protein